MHLVQNVYTHNLSEVYCQHLFLKKLIFLFSKDTFNWLKLTVKCGGGGSKITQQQKKNYIDNKEKCFIL